MNSNFDNTVTEIASDARSVFLWAGRLKDQAGRLKSDDEKQAILKRAMLEKLEMAESDLFAVANFISDCEAALKDNNILTDLIAELKA